MTPEQIEILIAIAITVVIWIAIIVYAVRISKSRKS